MIDQDFIMLIMSCKKYEKKANFQRKTWLLNIPSFLRFYHVIGEPELETTYTFDEENSVLRVKVDDDYNSLPNKVISSYQAVYETFNFKYIFKTDDDQMVVKLLFFVTLQNLITKMVPPPHYGGYIIDVKQPHISKYYVYHPELPKNLLIEAIKYCSGRFYFLSKLAVINLISKREIIIREYLEDYAIGYYLDEIYKTNILNIQTNRFFTDIENPDFSG